jgi:nucleotide-binding universal stress UspA family protein
MTAILYPTRGGDPTYSNQDWAISLALEREADLLLLYVSNVRFLDLLAGPVRVNLVEAELEELGEFLLTMAQERAEKAGQPAETFVRHGSFREALLEVAKEYNVSTVVLGYPTTDAAITTQEFINSVAKFLQSEIGVEVYVLETGDLVDHYQVAG